MNKILIIVILVLVSSNSDIDTLTFKEFTKFITKYNKKYTSLNEYMARFEVFKRNLMAIFEEAPQLPYEIGINQFTDLTDQEFAKTYLTLSYDAFDYINPYPVSLNENFEAAPIHGIGEVRVIALLLKIKAHAVLAMHLLQQLI